MQVFGQFFFWRNTEENRPVHEWSVRGHPMRASGRAWDHRTDINAVFDEAERKGSDALAK